MDDAILDKGFRPRSGSFADSHLISGLREKHDCSLSPQAHYANEDNGTRNEWSAPLILPCSLVSLTDHR